MTHEGPPPPSAEDAHREAMRAAIKRIDRVNDWLQLGGALPPEEYRRFRDAGITHVVDLREDAEVNVDLARLTELQITRLQVPVPNHGAPTIKQLLAIATWLDTKDETGEVYVHCGGGFGRAATMAVGLLIYSGARLDDAVQQVREARPEIRINADQLAWLRSVEERVSAETSKEDLG